MTKVEAVTINTDVERSAAELLRLKLDERPDISAAEWAGYVSGINDLATAVYWKLVNMVEPPKRLNENLIEVLMKRIREAGYEED